MSITTTIAGYEVGYPSDLDYLIGSLRSHLGDVTSPFTFSDGFLRKNLIDAFKSLKIRWQSRYKITAIASGYPFNYISSGIDYNYYSVSRNLNAWAFTDPEPPVIQFEDERPIVLMASIIIKGGSLTSGSSSSTYGSWRDDELSYSNIESGKTYRTSLEDDWNELNELFPSRAGKLARTRRQELPGFRVSDGNYWEG